MHIVTQLVDLARLPMSHLGDWGSPGSAGLFVPEL